MMKYRPEAKPQLKLLLPPKKDANIRNINVTKFFL